MKILLEWEDQLSLASPPPSQGSPAPSQSTPRKRPAPGTEHESSPAPKRFNASQNALTSSPRTPASQARLDAMRASQAEAGTNTVAHSDASPAPSSSRRVDVSKGSQPSVPLRIPGRLSVQPSSTSFRPVTPPTAERTEPQWPPQTPPSSRVVAQSERASRTRNENSAGTRNGMQNQTDLGASLGARLDADPFCSPSGSDTGPGDSEPRGTAVRSPVSADLDGSSIVHVYTEETNRTAALLRQFELRLRAAEKMNDAKARRMEQLQEEIDSLKTRNAALEQTLADLTGE
ncbi:hypothetical protein C8R43DRAFT_1117780 [Mycena crocata]|nr:hypothetical protein C8R43DRAFT_1117780 [Mycena crocata]